jgi:hypothetical protein
MVRAGAEHEEALRKKTLQERERDLRSHMASRNSACRWIVLGTKEGLNGRCKLADR